MKRRISTLLLLCWLCAISMAASPALHEWLHGADDEHGEHGEHQCVVNLIASGVLDAPTIQPILVSAPVMVERSCVSVQDSEVPAIFLGSGLSARGPPAGAA